MATITNDSMSTILGRLLNARFVASEDDVRLLASAVQHGAEANGAYLQVLLVECQARLGPGARAGRLARARPVPIETVVGVLNTAHARFYPHVLLGVGPEDLGKAELARRATFARSAKTTLMGAVKAGVDIRLINPLEITKRELRRLTKQAAMGEGEEGGESGEAGGEGEPTSELAKTVQRGERMMLNALTAMEAQDRDAAVAAVTRIIEALDKIVPLEEAVGAVEREPTGVGTIVGHRLQRAPPGRPTGHAPGGGR